MIRLRREDFPAILTQATRAEGLRRTSVIPVTILDSFLATLPSCAGVSEAEPR